MKANMQNQLTELDQLAIKYNADKFGKHNYTPFYHYLFRKMKGSVHKLIELGIAECASLKMWREYFPNAVIIGADNDYSRIDNAIEIGFPAYLCDQSIPQDLDNLIKNSGREINVFIDDGSHNSSDQLNTCLTVYPQLPDDAIYIIEDVADPAIFDVIENNFSAMMIKFSQRYDDRIIIVSKDLRI